MAVVLAPSLVNGRKQYFDANGNVLNGGQVFFYSPGTTNALNTYQDAEQTVPNPSPIVLNSAGTCVAFGLGKFREYVIDSLGNLVSDTIVNTIPPTGITPPTLLSLGVSSAMLPVIQAPTIQAANNLLGVSSHLNIAVGDQSITVAPVANAISTLTSLNVEGTTVRNSGREFLVNLGLNSNNGVNGVTGDGSRDKVTLYTGLEASAGTGDVWTINPCLTMHGPGDKPPQPPSGSYNAQGIEVDFNNNNKNYGASGTLSADFTTIANGMSITGSGAFSSTTGLSINSQGPAALPGADPNTPVQWNRGITTLGKMAICAYQDWTTAPVGIQFDGSYSTAAINFTSIYGNAGAGGLTAIFMKNNQAFSWQNQAKTAVISDFVDAQNNRIIGSSSLPGATASIILAGGVVLPQTTGTNLGTTNNRWGDVLATNVRLTNNTSLTWNNNPAAAGGVSAFIQDVVTPTNDRVVGTGAQTTYIGSSVSFSPITAGLNMGTNANYWGTITSIGGVVAPSDLRLKKNVEQLPDVGPIIDAIKPIKFQYKDDDEKTHWGFDAAEIKKTFGDNFAGYHEDEKGYGSVAKDELIAVLWKVCQELQADVAHLQHSILEIKNA